MLTPTVPDYVLIRHPNTSADEWRPLGESWVHVTASIAPDVVPHWHATIGPKAVVGPDVLLDPYVCILDCATIGARSTIAFGATIGARAKLGADVYIGWGVKVAQDMEIGDSSCIRRWLA